jgi:hypothetical protein
MISSLERQSAREQQLASIPAVCCWCWYVCLATNQNGFAWLQDRMLAEGPVVLSASSIYVSQRNILLEIHQQTLNNLTFLYEF